MFNIFLGIFMVLHGAVHLLYAAQSRGLFELKPGSTWPAGSWAFATSLGEKGTRSLAIGLCILVAAGFVLAGLGAAFSQPWWQPLASASALLSALLYLLLWNGRMESLDAQGGIGVLIDLAILITAWLVS
jgi:hypothetical protein